MWFLSSVSCWHIVARLYFRLLAGCVVSFVCSLLAHTVVARLHSRLLAGCAVPSSSLFLAGTYSSCEVAFSSAGWLCGSFV